MGLLDLIIIFLVITWIGGFSLHLFGGFIHLLIIIIVVILIIRLLGR